jgi:hypothetical protein
MLYMIVFVDCVVSVVVCACGFDVQTFVEFYVAPSASLPTSVILNTLSPGAMLFSSASIRVNNTVGVTVSRGGLEPELGKHCFLPMA